MSYQVLARKWRPKNFSEVVGQEHILTALTNGLRENRLHHAYLFSGTRGVGKTSIARLFAKGLNCITNGVTADPCGHCEHCKAIDAGCFIDLIEIDAASRTKVEDTRELLDNVQYKPTQGRYKVYLIDEVHMLSRHSFNALLKTLEEPPEYVKFLLATTDPQKLPITILSRCMQFHLKALEQKQIARHLDVILTHEKIPFEAAALSKLAKAAQGSIRDSLSLADQAIAMGNGQVTADVVNTMLGLLDENQPIEIVQALHQADGDALMAVVQQCAELGVNWEQLLIDIAEVLHQIAMKQLLSNNANDNEQIDFLAKYISPDDVQFFYQVMIMGRKEIVLAPDQRAGVEMTLLRALAFHPKFISSSSVGINDSQIKTDTETSTPYLPQKDAQNAVDQREDLVDVPVISASRLSAKILPQSEGLAALEQLKKLDVLKPLPSKDKNQDNSARNTNSAAKVIELPVVSTTQKRKTNTDLLERFANLVEQNINEDKPEPIPLINNSDNQPDENEVDCDDNYQWEWKNVEMAQEVQQVRPSEIKQAILNKRPKELVEKIIRLSSESDEWERIISELHLDKLIKQLALNSVILEKTAQQIKLGLRSNQAHLNKESAVDFLQKALSEYDQKAWQLSVEISDDTSKMTPLENRRHIYMTLLEQAKADLQQDEQLKLLVQELDAKLMLDTVLPST